MWNEKKNKDVVDGEKAFDALIEYSTLNKTKLVNMLNLSNEEGDGRQRFINNEPVVFRSFAACFALLTTFLPDEYIDKFYHEEEGEVLYAEKTDS